ncbi:MAG: LysR family transcriptional regulator [Deltaproteobacteria bacterium]|jgi:DNA-binding transcriptional LysR family regulator|nr:LysR family transcriptional regulator [Deltaproteobacteria bacterium]
MEFRLKIFHTVAQLKSFTKAAQVLNLTQPAITFQIKNLENHFRTRLFYRDANKISLTPSGRVLYQHVENILDEYENAKKEIAKVSGKLRGEIRIGIASLLGKYLMPRLIGYFKTEHSLIDIMMLVGNSGKLIQELKEHALDLVIVSEPISAQHFIVRPLLDDELVVIINPHHKWANRDTIDFNDLLTESFISREKGSGTGEVFKNFLSTRNVSIKNLTTVMTLGSSEAVKSAVESGVAYGIVSKMAVRREIEMGLLKQVKIKDVVLKRKFLIVYPPKQYNRHLVKTFLDFIVQKV